MKLHSLTLAAALLLTQGTTAHAQDSVRAEVARPMQTAQELMKANRFREALARVREADAVANLSPYERLLLDRMRGSAAAGAGDDTTATRSFEAALATGRLLPVETLPLLEALAASAYRAKDYAKAISWADRYSREGGRSEAMRSLKTNAQYQAGDYAGVVKDMEARVLAIETAVPVVDEFTLRTLAAAYAKLGDDAGYARTLDKLLSHHPKKDYWADRLSRLQNDATRSDRLTLDLYRLRWATDTLDDTEQIVEMAQLALQSGLPVEARRVIDAAYNAGRLGLGADAERHKRLRELARRQAAEDEAQLPAADVVGRSADALVSAGQILAGSGRLEKGLELMESGVAKGGLRRPDEARLHLGQAYLAAGNRARAVETFKTVKGGDGAAELARLWAIYAERR